MSQLTRLLTAHPNGVSPLVNGVVMVHVLLWIVVTVAGQPPGWQIPAQLVVALLQASLIGAWVGVGRGLLVLRAFFAICTFQLVNVQNRYIDVNKWALVPFACVATMFLASEHFGFRFAFANAAEPLPAIARSQFSLRQAFMITTVIAVALGATKFLQWMFGDNVWVVVLLLVLQCLITFGLCVSVLSVQNWVVRSSLAVLSALLVCCVAPVIIASVTNVMPEFAVPAFAAIMWLLMLLTTLVAVRAAGYRFGRFVVVEPPPPDRTP